MAMRPGSSGAAWFSAAAHQTLDRAAQSYDSMADRVEIAAKAAAEKHITGPAADGMRQQGATQAADALGVFTENDQMYVGLPDDHPALSEAQDAEFGVPGSQAPGGHLRSALFDRVDDARVAFHQGLLGQ